MSDEDAIVTVGDGKITLRGAATLSAVHIDGTGSTVSTDPLRLTNYTSYKKITGTSYNDSIWNEGGSVTINAAAGNDSIVNTGDNSSLNTGDGNDHVSNTMSRYVTINSGSGKDTIYNTALAFTKIDAGADNDSIYSFSDYTTINGGTGNDTVSLNTSGGHNVIEYVSGDGNDIIYDLGSTDTLKITNGAWFSVANGDDVLVNVDSGTITLNGAKGKTVNIDGKKLTSIIVDDYETIEVEDLLSHLTNATLYGSNINNSKNTALITGTDYNDTIKNAGNTIFVRAGAGQDSIYNTGYALIEAGTGSDTVTNYGNYSTILGGDGNDSIYNRANGVFIYSDAGKDNIYFSGQSSYILSGADNDSIYVTGSGNRVYAGEGNDTISITSSATAITIEGGRGDDVIIGKGLAQTFLYASGDGNDLIQDFKINSTLQIGDGKGTYSTVKSGSDIIVIVGDGQVTLQGATKLSKLNIAGIYENSLNINGTNSSESIINSLTGATIHTFSGNDTINNWGANVLIDSGADNDLIQNYYNSNVIIQGKDGNDSILNFYSDNVTLDGGEGDDSIQSDYSSNIFINCSDGKDTVDNWSSFITIDSGAGNDFIENHHSNVTINGGADNDTVFNDGGYNHIFINTGAGNDSVLNYSRLVTIDGGDGYDTIKNYYSELVTIIGNRGNDYIDNNAQNVLFNYKAGDGNDFIRGFNETSTLQISDGNGTYSSQKSGSDVLVSVGSSVITLEGASTLSIVNINGTEGNYWNLNDATAKYGNSIKTLVTVKGIKSLDGISLSGTTVTVKESSLNKTNVTISDGYTLKLSDVNPPTPTPAHFDDLTYKSESNSEGYSLSSDKKIISYSPTVAETDLFTLTNVKNTGSIAVNRTDKTVTLKANNLTSKNVTITGNAYTLALGSDVPTSAKQTAGSFTSFSNGTAKFKSNSFSAFYTLSSKKISYTAASGGKEITIAGLKKSLKLKNSAIAGITPTYSNDVTTFKIKADDLTTGNVTLTGEGKLQLDGYTKPKTVAASFVGGVYTRAYTPAFYTATDKKITYTTRVGGDKFSITGLKSSANPTKSNTGIKVDSKGVVTISATALDGKSVTLVNDTADDVNKITYKLAIDSSVSTKATTTNASWTKKNSSFTYTAPITSAFYTLKGNKLNYTAKTGGSQFTVTGLKNTSAVTVSGKKVTIGNASLNGKAVTLTGDYTLALAKDVPTSAKKTAGNFSVVSKGTATYKTTTFGGYYKISSKKTSFITATGGQAITIKNLNTSANLSTVKKGITVAEQSNGTYKITFKNSGVLTTKAPTVSVAKGLKYTVAVADSLKPVTKVATWNVSGTTAVFRFDTTAGYTVKNNAVVYSAKKNGLPLMELTNLAKGVKASSITTKGKIVTLNSSVLGAKTSVKSNNGSYSINLTGNMSKKKFIGTSKADTLIVAANNASIDSGAGNDVVTVSSLKVTINGGTGNDKLSGGKNVDWIYGGANNDSILGNAGNDHLFGEAGNDSLRGGAGADTLTSGKGDDHLWGDAGKDTFIYASGDGKDVIHGFENGDLLQITGTFNASYNKSKKEIYFKVGSTASAITLKDFTATSFNINGDSYKISGTKLVKR